MTSLHRRRLTLALFISLLIHLSVVVAPGWYLPTLDDPQSADSAPQLEAHLSSLSTRQVAASVAPAPMPQRKPRHKVQEPAPVHFDNPPIELPPAVPSTSQEVPTDSAVTGAAASSAPSRDSLPAGDSAGQARGSSLPQSESSLPRQGRIRFSISRGDQGFVIGQAVHRWSHDGKRYTLNSVTETTGIAAIFRPVQVMQTSEGEIDAVGLHPSEFHTEKNGVAGDAASFDWASMKLKLSAGSQREVTLVAGAQDMLSMFYQIGAVFPWVPLETNEIMVATGRKFERYAFEVVREETLTTKLGEMRTLHLRTAAGVEAIDVWVCLDLHGLPSKIRYTDRQGESFEQVADEIEFDGMPVSTRNR